MREDEPIVDLAELRQVESPEVVHAAMRKFRRRLRLWAVVVVAAVVGVMLVVTAPSVTPWLPTRMAQAGPVEVMERVEQGPVQVLVLDAARLEDSYVLRLVVDAQGLDPTEGVFVGQRFAVWVPEADPEVPGAREEDVPPPPPGPPTDLGGVLTIADSGFGAGAVQEVWIEVALGSARPTVTIAAGVPARPGPGEPPTSDLVTSDLASELLGPPTEPGTERILAEVELDVRELGVDDRVWRP